MQHPFLPSLSTLPVFYTEQMVADAASYSPSAAKPRAVLAAWEALGLPLTRIEPEPVSPAQLALAHDADYVARVLACQTENGFGNRLPAVARSLPYTSGAMLAAAQEALRNGRVAVAPCSGFHHAGYGFGGGFCTFNGLMVTAMSLLKDMQFDRIGILDSTSIGATAPKTSWCNLALRSTFATTIRRAIFEATRMLCAFWPRCRPRWLSLPTVIWCCTRPGLTRTSTTRWAAGLARRNCSNAIGWFLRGWPRCVYQWPGIWPAVTSATSAARFNRCLKYMKTLCKNVRGCLSTKMFQTARWRTRF